MADEQAGVGVAIEPPTKYREPWRAQLIEDRNDGASEVVDCNGYTVVDLGGGDCLVEDELELARRIAACINTCHDLATEDLERFTGSPKVKSEDADEMTIHTDESIRREHAMRLALIHTAVLLREHVIPILRATRDSITDGYTIRGEDGVYRMAGEDETAKKGAESCRAAIEQSRALLDEIAEVGR